MFSWSAAESQSCAGQRYSARPNWIGQNCQTQLNCIGWQSPEGWQKHAAWLHLSELAVAACATVCRERCFRNPSKHPCRPSVHILVKAVSLSSGKISAQVSVLLSWHAGSQCREATSLHTRQPSSVVSAAASTHEPTHARSCMKWRRCISCHHSAPSTVNVRFLVIQSVFSFWW